MFLFRDTGLPRAPHSSLLRWKRVRSFTGCRGISPPKHPISALPRHQSPARLTLESFREEPAVTGLDWPFTTNPRLHECFARQQRFGPPSLVRATSSYPGIDRPASGLMAVTTGRLRPRLSQCCRLVGFPSTTRIILLVSPQPKTPWPVFQDG